MLFKPVHSQRLYRQIADQILALFDQGHIKAGDRLPSERALAEQLGVSRSSVREALIALEMEGRVEVGVGVGIFVRASRPTSATVLAGSGDRPVADPLGPFDILRTRCLIEGEAAALAARNANAAQIAVIELAYQRLADDWARGHFNHQNDRDFHLAITDASGNGALTFVSKALWDQQISHPLFDRFDKLFVAPGRRKENLAEHEAITKAIAARDPKLARASLVRHLTNAEKVRLQLLKRDEDPSQSQSKSKLSPGSQAGPATSLTDPHLP